MPMGEVDVSVVVFTDASLTLTGISAPIPEGWVRESPGMNPSSPGLSRKAQFRLPKADNQAEDASVATSGVYSGLRNTLTMSTGPGISVRRA